MLTHRKLYPIWIPGNIFKCYGFGIILKEGFECTEKSAPCTDNCAWFQKWFKGF
jgi:hypothetical protein